MNNIQTYIYKQGYNFSKEQMERPFVVFILNANNIFVLKVYIFLDDA